MSSSSPTNGLLDVTVEMTQPGRESGTAEAAAGLNCDCRGRFGRQLGSLGTNRSSGLAKRDAADDRALRMSRAGLILVRKVAANIAKPTASVIQFVIAPLPERNRTGDCEANCGPVQGLFESKSATASSRASSTDAPLRTSGFRSARRTQARKCRSCDSTDLNADGCDHHHVRSRRHLSDAINMNQ